MGLGNIEAANSALIWIPYRSTLFTAETLDLDVGVRNDDGSIVAVNGGEAHGLLEVGDAGGRVVDVVSSNLPALRLRHDAGVVGSVSHSSCRQSGVH